MKLHPNIGIYLSTRRRARKFGLRSMTGFRHASLYCSFLAAQRGHGFCPPLYYACY